MLAFHGGSSFVFAVDTPAPVVYTMNAPREQGTFGPYNREFRTVSGPEGSSTKKTSLCDMIRRV